MYKKSHKHGIGLEDTEELLESLIDRGDLIVMHNSNKDTYKIVPWNMID